MNKNTISALIGLSITFVLGQSAGEWEELTAGMERGVFYTQQLTEGRNDSSWAINVIRIDPDYFELIFLDRSQTPNKDSKTAKNWSMEYGLAAVINGGMFEPDQITHTGYCKDGNHINNDQWREYESIAAFAPKNTMDASFQIFDRDRISSLDNIFNSYNGVVQNLRLIKRSRENRWPQQERIWSEAALGEDSIGRILFIFSRFPYSMHDFNNILLNLPIDIVSAQHLDGGPPAQLYVNAGGNEIELIGTYETDHFEKWVNTKAWEIVSGQSKCTT